MKPVYCVSYSPASKRLRCEEYLCEENKERYFQLNCRKNVVFSAYKSEIGKFIAVSSSSFFMKSIDKETIIERFKNQYLEHLEKMMKREIEEQNAIIGKYAVRIESVKNWENVWISEK